MKSRPVLERFRSDGVVEHRLERVLIAQRLLDLLHRNPGYSMWKSAAVTWFAVRNSVISCTVSEALPRPGTPRAFTRP